MADREDIAYKSDLDGFVKGPSVATSQKIAVFGSESGTIEASTVSISDVPTEETIEGEVESAVSSATSEIWNAVKGVDALQAYASQEWGSGVSYAVGDFCRYDGTGYAGYKCKEEHTSGQSFDTSKWEGVLTDDGCSAIDEILSGYSTEGLASILDIAPAWNSSSSVEYKVGQLAKKDGILQICTVAGHGVAATFSASGANVDASISERISALDTALQDVITQHTSNTTIHVTEEDKETWSGKQDAISDLSEIREDAEAGAAAAERDKVVISDGNVTAKHADDTGSVELASKSSVDGKADAVAIDDEYDTSSSGYSVGDTCIHDGKWYKCKYAVSTGSSWNSSNWDEITVKGSLDEKQDTISDLSDIRSGAEDGSEAAERDKVVISNGTVTAKHADDTGPIVLANQSSVDGKAEVTSIDDEYNTYSSGYSVGDTCTHDGRWYKCKSAVAARSDWDASSWEEITVKEALSEKQNAIDDLSDIRADAEAGADAAERDKVVIENGTVTAQHADGTGSIVLASKSYVDGKQDAIPDLSEIREDAEAGAAAAERDKVVISNGTVTAKHADDTGSIVLAIKASVDEKADSAAIDDEYNTYSSGYSVGDTCTHDGRWYKCKSDVAARSDWDSSSWDEITVKGSLDEKQNTISDLSDIRSGAEDGSEAAERDKVVISNGNVTAKHADNTGSVDLASKSSVDSKAESVAIDDEYDTSSSGYSVGDTCMHDGKWYKCREAVSTGAEWDSSSWNEITVKDAIESGAATREQADWTENDDTKPSYIKHKPTIPAETVIDDTLTQEGEAADAKAVGEAIDGVRADMVDVGMLPYEIKELLEVGSSDSAYDDTKETYRLLDRTVNVIETTINDNKTIALIPPEVPSASSSSRKLARDFYVVLLVDADNDVGVSMTSMSLKDCNEGSVTLYVPKGEHVTYRFTDADENHSVFLVTLFADPAIQKIRQIEKALDDILRGEGIVTPSRDGIMIYDVTDGKYHRMVAVTDEETGAVNLSVDNEGVDL